MPEQTIVLDLNRIYAPGSHPEKAPSYRVNRVGDTALLSNISWCPGHLWIIGGFGEFGARESDGATSVPGKTGPTGGLLAALPFPTMRRLT